MIFLSVIILTRDEEIQVERAIRFLVPLVAQIFLVDSFSTDRMAEIAQILLTHVVQHEFVSYAQQFQWALENLPIETDWVMRLDADEVGPGSFCTGNVTEMAASLLGLVDKFAWGRRGSPAAAIGARVCFLDGRGRGQVSSVAGWDGSVVRLDRRLAVSPDSIQFFGTSVDHVVSGNISIRTSG